MKSEADEKPISLKQFWSFSSFLSHFHIAKLVEYGCESGLPVLIILIDNSLAKMSVVIKESLFDLSPVFIEPGFENDDAGRL